MIHQLIFACAKPGITEKEFQDYWLNVHAVKYACKIPQIKKYKIDRRIPFGPEPEELLCQGVAEIWLPNEEEQLASLQTKEFVEGARADETKWAAFWRTIVMDTSDRVLVEGPPETKDSTMIKLFMLVKRKEGMSLEDFRKYSVETHGPKVKKLPGLQRYYQCMVNDGCYKFGEAILDAAYMLWFENTEDLAKAMASSKYKQEVEPDLVNFANPKYVHTFVTDENWVLGPEARD